MTEEVTRVINALLIAPPEEVTKKAGEIITRCAHVLYGFNTTVKALAALYVASMLSGRPWSRRTILKYCEALYVRAHKVYEASRRIKRALGIASPRPEHFVDVVATKLGLPPAVRERAKVIVRAARLVGLVSGKGPSTVAAAAVYLAAREAGISLCQKDVAAAADVTEITLRRRINDLLPLSSARLSLDAHPH